MPSSFPHQSTKKRAARIAVVRIDENVEESLPTNVSSTSSNLFEFDNGGNNTTYSSNRYQHVLRPRKKQNRSTAPLLPPVSSKEAHVKLPLITSPRKQSMKGKDDTTAWKPSSGTLDTFTQPIQPLSTKISSATALRRRSRTISMLACSKTTSTPIHSALVAAITPHLLPTVSAATTPFDNRNRVDTDRTNQNTDHQKKRKYHDPRLFRAEVPFGVADIFPEKKYPTCTTTRHNSTTVPVQRADDHILGWSSDFISTYGPDFLFLAYQYQCSSRDHFRTMRHSRYGQSVETTNDDIFSPRCKPRGSEESDSNDEEDEISNITEDIHESEDDSVQDTDQPQSGISDRPLAGVASDNETVPINATPTKPTDIIVADHIYQGPHEPELTPTARQNQLYVSAIRGQIENQCFLSTKMRRTLVLWMSEVCQQYQLSDATYHLSVTLVDQTLLHNPFDILREQFQAVGWYVWHS